MDDLVSFLPVLLGLFALPLFFYKLDKGGLLLSLAVQFILVYIVFCQISAIPVVFYLFWGVYAFSVVAVLVFSLCSLLADNMIEWILFRDYPLGFGTPFVAFGFAFFLFTLVTHLYYIFAYQSYKVRYFVLSMLPYLSIFILGVRFASGRESYYFLVTLFSWLATMAVAFFIKNRYG